MTSEQNMDKCDDRRNYFRVDDEVILQYRAVPEDSVDAFSRSDWSAPADGFSLRARFAALNRELIALMREIESDSTATAKYLAAIDMKLDMLAQVLLRQESAVADKPVRKVNISAGGIAFTTDRLLDVGSVLELQMILLPEMIGLTIFGRVVASGSGQKAPSGSGYLNSVEFVGLREEYRDLIVCHVRRREQEILRKKRLNRNGPA